MGIGRRVSAIGSKKKKTTTTVVTTKIKVVKLSYLQTLAVHQNVLSTDELKTKGGILSAEQTSKSSKRLFPLLGLGKKSSSTDSKTRTSGVKVKDQWLQPYYDKIRYSIGIREFSVSRYKFAKVSEFISKPFISPKEIVKVNVVVDEYIPAQFDQNQIWIKYYIKVEGEDEWIRIQPLNTPTKFNDLGEIIPKIINFNLPRPTTAKLEDKFNTTEDPVKQVRFRAIISRPDGVNEDSMTPMLKSYRIVMIPRR